MELDDPEHPLFTNYDCLAERGRENLESEGFDTDWFNVDLHEPVSGDGDELAPVECLGEQLVAVLERIDCDASLTGKETRVDDAVASRVEDLGYR